MNQDPLAVSEARGPLTADELPRVIHSHHYNVKLTRSFLEMERVDAYSILRNAASELAFDHLSGDGPKKGLLNAAAALFEESGLGRLDFGKTTSSGGEILVRDSHIAVGWCAKFGIAERSVCALPAGFIAGSLEAAFGRPFDVRESQCVASGASECRFTATLAVEERIESAPPAPAPSLFDAAPPAPPAFDEEAILAALLGGGSGSETEEKALSLGGSLTRLWADYYNRISYRFEREVPRAMGAKFANLPSLVLTEAGHSYAYYTFGKILRSPEWHERVVPRLASREDWFHAIIAVINSLGWGTWRVEALVPNQRAIVRVHDGYEAAGYRRHFGVSDVPRCYLARGTVAALMNLLYVGDPAAHAELTTSYYNLLFRSPLSYRALETRCRAMDDPCCEVVANPMSPGLGSRMRELLK